MIGGNMPNAQNLIAKMRARMERTQDLSTPLQSAGAYERDAAVKRFKDEGGDQYWPPNKRGGHTGIDTGRLWQGIAVSPPDPTRVVVSDNVFYARYFQEGTGIFAGHSEWTVKPKKGKALAFTVGGQSFVVRSVTIPGQPKRPFLVISDTDREHIAQIFQAWIVQGEQL